MIPDFTDCTTPQQAFELYLNWITGRRKFQRPVTDREQSRAWRAIEVQFAAEDVYERYTEYVDGLRTIQGILDERNNCNDVSKN